MNLGNAEIIPGSVMTRSQKIQIQMNMEPVFSKIEAFEQMVGKERMLAMQHLNEEREKRVMEEAMKISQEKKEKKNMKIKIADKKKSDRSTPY
jgi:hypothetical protein